MLAPVTSTAEQSGNSLIDTTRPRPRKTRVARRRGRARHEESDEEIEREVTSDDESDDDHSSLGSGSDSESFSEDGHLNGRSEVVTPSTTQSPPPLDIDGRTPPAGSKHTSMAADVGPFVSATDWADMVTAEHANGAEDLPVIDFADLDRQRIDQHLISPHLVPKKLRKQAKRAQANRASSAPPTSPPIREVQPEEEQAPPSSGHPAQESQPRGPRGPSARQAYQQRLETDPSFVPKVGEFWGHDDRLLDKDLRSLSGWWRGRWQSRGRGRGAFAMRGRGGRGFFGGRFDGGGGDEGELVSADDIPPVEKPWTHDGFEEMRRRDEKRRGLQSQRSQEQERQPELQHVRFGPQRGFGFRGRGFFGGRGRGGFTRSGSGSDSPVRAAASNMPAPNRIWFAMKPERMWTKQHEAFLYLDPALKPRPGMGPGYRVKLPGGEDLVVRAPPKPHYRNQVGFTGPASPLLDEGEKAAFVVRLPRRAGEEKATNNAASAPVVEAAAEEPATTVGELSLEEVFTVRPNLVPNRRVDVSAPQPSASPVPAAPSPASQTPPPGIPALPHRPLSSPRIPSISSLNGPRLDAFTLQPPVVRPSSASPSPQIKETVLRRASVSTQSSSILAVPAPQAERPAPPILPPLQTNFSPVPQTSPPPYGSPYAYAPALPPGVGLSQHGMPYELATGRPVYFHQPTPPPPPMFTPRPVMYSHTPHPSMTAPFVPAHMHHHSHSVASPDFLAPSHTPPVQPPVQFIDPSTGVPIFTPARQTSRIEIRAPTDTTDGKKPSSRPSGSSSVMAGPPRPIQEGASATRLEAAVSNVDTHPASSTATLPGEPAPAMGYYPQQYYYPDPYAYPAYMDVSPQVMPYEMYPSDHSTHHQPQPPMIYY
ncbi:hypothetical protein DAEQUDRAFT_809817 [Daedalea quercina L-15889]|uniref:Btz domain-containing protein n=1 Tax=Daedalea quercina L-15889 TaxID=1314783 RepID=A0A165S3P2_9APHY|nr:hypothetical protein DAEQUDRAFT_809817 [Daedalea quercina L-15889]